MLFKNFCRGALALSAALMLQSAVLNNAKADEPTPADAGGWVADPALAGQLQPAQQFGKYSLQIPSGYTELKPKVKTVTNGTETLYRFVGEKRLDKTVPEIFVYVMEPTGDAKASQPLLTNPIPEWVQGIHFWNQSSGTINGLPAVHQLWSYRLSGQKPVSTGTEYTSTDGSSTIAVAGLDADKHFNESAPIFKSSALSLHE